MEVKTASCFICSFSFSITDSHWPRTELPCIEHWEVKWRFDFPNREIHDIGQGDLVFQIGACIRCNVYIGKF